MSNLNYLKITALFCLAIFGQSAMSQQTQQVNRSQFLYNQDPALIQGIQPPMPLQRNLISEVQKDPLEENKDSKNTKELELDLPEKPITDFQRFVFETTGRLLPYYGDKALKKSLSPDNSNLPVSADYAIGAGDEVFVRIWGGVDVDHRAKVDRDGQLTIPSVGTFPVAGVLASDLDDYLSGEVGKYFKNFKLSATLGRLGGVNIYVTGQALAPGMHAVNSTSTLASVLFTVAQPGANGSYRDVQLKRGNEVIAQFDLYDLLRKGDLTGNRKLRSGDVIVIGNAGSRIALNVNGPAAAIFELKANETLSDVLNLAGVDRTLLRQDSVLIEGVDSRSPNAPRRVEQLSYDRAMSEARLNDGDIVTLFQARRAFSNAVTLKGNVAEPARYPYFQGMTIADLIPDTEALIQPDYFKKKGALVGFDKQKADRAMQDKRLQEGLSLEEQQAQRRRFEKLNGLSTNDDETKIEVIQNTVKNLLPPINWDYAVIERLNKNELKSVLLPFNLKKAMARDPAENLTLMPGDVITIFGVSDAEIPKSRKTPLIKVTGEVSAPGYYQIAPGETLRDVVVKAGGLTQDAYLFGTRLVRESIMEQQRVQFEKALAQAERLLMAANNSKSASALTPADAANAQSQAQTQMQFLDRLRSAKPDGRVVLNVSDNARSVAELPPLVLEDGDTITIPPMPGQVSIFGSVYSQGAFAYEKGKTVFDYLNQAGGAAKSSDKGSIFVLRANGTVDSAQQSWVPFVSGLYGQKALPGDAIYVPEDFERVSFMKTLIDVSQIFYQVGLGAAAVRAIQD